MTNYNNRTSGGPYNAEIGGCTAPLEPTKQFATIREARKWAESHFGMANYCLIYDRKGRLAARHQIKKIGHEIRWVRVPV